MHEEIIKCMTKLHDTLMSLSSAKFYFGHLEHLLKVCDNINKTDRGYKTLLTLACSFCSCNIDVVQMLIKYGADVNLADQGFCEDTPLCWACYCSNTQLVRLLLSYKADPNICNANESYPISFACANRNYDIVKLLIDAGSVINTQEIRTQVIRKSPLYKIFSRKYSDTARPIRNSIEYINPSNIIKLLVFSGANLDVFYMHSDFYNFLQKYDVIDECRIEYKKKLLDCVNDKNHELCKSFENYGDLVVINIITEYLI